MSEKIKNFLANDSTNSYIQYGIGEYLPDNQSTINRVLNVVDYEGVLDGVACFSYEYLESSKCLRKDTNFLPEGDNVVFTFFAPNAVSSDGRSNTKPHSLIFSFNKSAMDFNPADLIGNANLGRIFDVLRDNDLSVEEKEKAINKIGFVNDKMFSSVQVGDIFLDGFRNNSYLNPDSKDKRRVVLEIVDHLISTNFKKPVAVVADKSQLAQIIKAALALLPCEIAKDVSFITIASNEKDVQTHLLSGVDFKNAGIAKDAIVINNNSLDNKYDSLYIRNIDSLSMEIKEDDELLKKLLSQNDYKKYFDYFFLYNADSSADTVGEVFEFMFDNFSGEELINSALLKNAFMDLCLSINEFSSYHIDVDKFVDYLILLKNSFDDGYLEFINRINLNLLLNEKISDGTKQQLCYVFSKILESGVSNLDERLVTSVEQNIENLDGAPRYVTNYVVSVLVYLLENQKLTEKLSETIIQYYGMDACSAFINKVLSDKLVDNKYELLKQFIIHFIYSIPDIGNDNSNEEQEFARKFKNLVMEEDNFERNIALINYFEKEYAKNIDEERYLWLKKYTMRSFANLKAVLDANEKAMKDEKGVDFNQLHYQTSLYLSRHRKDINYENIVEIYEIYELYKRKEPLSAEQQIDVDEIELTDYINELYKEYQDRESTTQVFASGGDFNKRRLAFEQLTEKMLDADAQSKRIFTMHTSSFVFLGILAIASILLLIPIYILNTAVFVPCTLFPALSIFYSSIIQFAFNKAGLRTLNMNMLRANLYGIYLPEIIIIIVLIIFLFV